MASSKRNSVPEYNILLLGESGAGKSLMINSIPLYLQHRTLEDSLQSSKIPCLIPVAFTILTEDYEEKKVTYGGQDENENHVEGESYTVGCTSYEFQCDNCVIRLIDSPGVDSTQGNSQVEINMEHIMESINTYKEIHAIAIVLKANQTKLSTQLKSCLDQILAHLHSSASANLIFLLTHSESTDYKPGSIMQVLKKYFEEMKTRSKVNVTFNKSNVFCVDNKGFRYIVAKTQGALSDEEPLPSFVTSYAQSANEFGRLLKYVIGGLDCPGLSPHQVVDTWTVNEIRQLFNLVVTTFNTIIKEIDKHECNLKDMVQQKEKLIDTIVKNQDICRKKERINALPFIKKKWSCQSEKCRNSIVEKKGQVIFYYPQICTNVSKVAWTIRRKCSICHCKASEHRKMNAETKTIVGQTVEAVTNKNRLEQDIIKMEAKKSKLEEERNFIESAIKTFDEFYLGHATVLANNTNLSRAQSISSDCVTLEKVIETKNKLFELELFGSYIKYNYYCILYNRRSTNLNSIVRVGNTFQLAKRFPQLKFW